MKTIEIALSQIGIKEIEGEQDNPEVLKYFEQTGFDGSKLKDETAWCSAFVNWVAKKAELEYSGKLTARSWLKVGKPVEEPQLGDVVIFWRESIESWKGHVGFFIRQSKDGIFVLGGNQNNAVSISKYTKDRLLGYRKLEHKGILKKSITKGYKFGKNSLDRLSTCHPDLQKILKLAIFRTKIDFGISEGHRSLERQNELFLSGKSKIDGHQKKGKHNFSPSQAADIYAYHPDKETRTKIAYDKANLSYIGGVIDSVAQELYYKDEISHIIRWGANWDSDGVIGYDQDFDDYPHFEIVVPK